jgi:hypothetical protein
MHHMRCMVSADVYDNDASSCSASLFVGCFPILVKMYVRAFDKGFGRGPVTLWIESQSSNITSGSRRDCGTAFGVLAGMGSALNAKPFGDSTSADRFPSLYSSTTSKNSIQNLLKGPPTKSRSLHGRSSLEMDTGLWVTNVSWLLSRSIASTTNC